MRIFPQSIRNRTTAVLIIGLLLVMILSMVISHLVVQDDREFSNHWQLIERIRVVTQILDDLSPDQRTTIAKKLSNNDINITWSNTTEPPNHLVSDWGSKKIQKLLTTYLSDLNLQKIRSGHINHDTTKPHNQTIAKGPLGIALQLQDQSWLIFTSDRQGHTHAWLIRLAIGILVFGGGISALAIWTTRRIIKPLESFAEASQHFGMNVDAPPMSECGPSEIKRAVQSFNQMQQRIRLFVQERMQMIAAISHDLKTPLTRLRLRTEFIEDESQRNKALEDLQDMQVILDSTLSFAKEHTNNEAHTHVDLAALIQSLCDDLSDAGHDIKYQGPNRLTYHCAPVSIRRALCNVINNAIQYGQQAEVELHANATQFTILVNDRGPGIPEDKKVQVFSPFFRLEKSRNRETGGTGLGLAVTRTVIRQHGGDIVLADRTGGGLQVIIKLPLQ